MKGADVISELKRILGDDDLIVSSNGNVSRQAYHLLPGSQLYLRGSMGLPVSIGLGLALAQPEKTVIVLTGDGNFLMGLSSMSTVAYINPPNLKIIIIDNQLYATTGGQETSSSQIDYKTMIEGMGILNVKSFDLKEMDHDIGNLLLLESIEEEGIYVLHLQVEEDTIELDNIPWHPEKITENFKNRHKGELK